MQTSTDGVSQPGFLTYAQLIVSGVGLLGAVLGTGLLLIAGLAVLMGDAAAAADKTMVFSLLWISALTIALILPSVVFSLERLRKFNFKLPQINGFRLASLLILFWPLVLGLGYLAAGQEDLAWLLLPPLQILAVGLPIIWLISMVHRQLAPGSRQQGWGIANFSLLITTPLVILVEIIVFVILLIVFVIYVMGQPALLNELQRLAQRLAVAQPDPNVILPLLRPYLQQPAVIVGILAILSGLMPLLEELLKPLALWALAGRRLTPAEGFIGGAICGGIFALLESLLSLVNPGQEGWVTLAVGRAGTGLLHITTTALIGWAMASAWQQGTYLKLGLTYLLSSAIHGFWNAFSVFSGLGVFLENGTTGLGILPVLTRIAPVMLILLVVGMFGLLWGVNRKLQKDIAAVEPVSIDSTHST